MRMSTLERFDSRAKKPADFDAFWRETQTLTNAVPLEGRITPLGSPLHGRGGGVRGVVSELRRP